MILAAGLLVLAGLGLFVAGLATGPTVFYWATVAVCAVAAVLLVLSRRQPAAGGRVAEEPATGTRRPPRTAEMPAGSGAGAPSAAQDDEAAAPDEGPDQAVEKAVHGLPRPAATAPAVREVRAPSGPVDKGEPPLEDVEVTDLLLVVDLKDEVLVIDEHPRYHLEGCPRLAGRETIPLPLDEARTDGFTPCGICSPDRTLAERERARRAGRGSP